LPEFLWRLPESATHFYEIRDTATVVDITADLPGLLRWNTAHSLQPLTFWVDDPRHIYTPHQWLTVSRVYQWNGEQFADVTADYAGEYVAEANTLADEWRERSGHPLAIPLDEMSLLRIPLLYEKAGMREKGLETILELADLARAKLEPNR
jgi:hypothetical protein